MVSLEEPEILRASVWCERVMSLLLTCDCAAGIPPSK